MTLTTDSILSQEKIQQETSLRAFQWLQIIKKNDKLKNRNFVVYSSYLLFQPNQIFTQRHSVSYLQ